jgi:hypothetical protein
MSLADRIKQEAKKSGQNKGKFIFFKESVKVRIRFLSDMDDGMEVVFHDSYEKSINVPCQETFDRECQYCEDESLRTRSMYIWSVWDYEAKEVRLFMFAVNNCSPIPNLMAMYETYGTLTDRDYVITKSGKGQSTSYAVVPCDKVKFKNEKAKPYSEKKTLELLDKAYPDENADNDDEEEETKKSKSKKSTKKSDKQSEKKSSKSKKVEEEEDEEEPDDEEEKDEVDYSEMSAKELYKLCKERNIDVEPKKSEKYYIKQLEEADKAEDDWGDEEEEEEWEDE